MCSVPKVNIGGRQHARHLSTVGTDVDTPAAKRYLPRHMEGTMTVLRRPRAPIYLACIAVLLLAPAARAEVPSWLPRYDVDVQIATERQLVVVKERVTWTNPHPAPTNKIVFNA